MRRILQLTEVEDQQLAQCEAIFQVGLPELESPFKHNATTLPHAAKLLSVKSMSHSIVGNVLQPSHIHRLSHFTAVLL